jgi:branched-chain amino acid transport system substrate-binding protein
MKVHGGRQFLARKRMGSWRLIPLLFACLMVLPAYTYADEYTIGLILQGNTPPMAQDGPPIELALQIFKSELKGRVGAKLAEEFGFQPPPIKFLVKRKPMEDGSPAPKVAREIVNSPCVAAITLWDTETVLGTRKIFEDNKMVLMAPVDTDPKITQGSDYIFTLMYCDRWQGAVLAEYVYKVMGKEKVAVVHQDDAYGKGLANHFVKQAKVLGFSPSLVLSVPAEHPRSRRTWAEITAKSLQDVDAIVILTYQDIGLSLLHHIRKMGIMIDAIGSDGLVTGSLARRASHMARSLRLKDIRLMVASPFFYELAPLRAYDFKLLFDEKVKQRQAASAHSGGTPGWGAMQAPPYAGLFVDAALLITRGIMHSIAHHKKGPQDVRRGIKEYLKRLNSPEKAVDGMSGRLYFDKNNNVPRPVLFGWLRDDSLRPAFVQLRKARQTRKNVGSSSDADNVGHEVLGVPLKRVFVVYTGMNVYRIDNVDLERQSFDAELFAWFKWKGPKDLQLNRNTIFLWNSIYSVNDQVIQLAEEVDQDLKYACFRIKSSFLGDFDLHKYPFDLQNLRFQLSLPTYGTDQVLLTVDQGDPSARDRFKVYPKEYKPVGEVMHVSGTRQLASNLGDPATVAIGASGIDFSVHEMSLHLQRDDFPYLLKLFLPLLILTGISLAVYWIPITHFAVRIGSLLTALLSTLVFHMAKDQTLPNIGYMTLADKYFVFAYLVMAVSVIAVITVEWIAAKQTEERARKVNAGCRYLVTIGAILIFVRLSWAVIGALEVKVIVTCAVIALVWLVCEFVLYNPFVQARIKSKPALPNQAQ